MAVAEVSQRELSKGEFSLDDDRRAKSQRVEESSLHTPISS